MTAAAVNGETGTVPTTTDPATATDAAGTAPTGAAAAADAATDAAPDAAGAVVTEETVPARAPWSAFVRRGQQLTITDLHGNQAVDFLVYDAHDTDVRYSAADTVHAQGGIFLTTGSVLMSNEHTRLMTIAEDTCGRHDTVGGACSKESNTLRYGHHTWPQHGCVENFLLEGARYGLGKRDLVSNVNWYMNVPVEEDGTLGIVDGISAPGLKVVLRAERDVLVLASNCPQINNPCNGFEPTAVRMTITEGAA
ncbi:urea carboxylase-associated family protein [Streptomyces sp. HNM0575]|uniref:urea amidolyase associated protein UAAP2 n=1 Tax=Streptomyces sp. HNM0575 TaxID=2716338 RepID=UPI00145E68F5|nr:urea amidolyase associated protein UAAP2 [Streptomyces sp. HNM0575]NLU74987.1 urea carboxylase-associated family protein [Streptomyces sp. HNM0575]